MSKQRFILFLGILVVLAAGCSSRSQTLNVTDYLKWINDADNGLVKTKYVNGVEIRVKYLSPEYLAYKEISKDPSLTALDKDSLIGFYKVSLNFLLTLGPDERKGEGQEITYRDVSDYGEYKERIKTLNFQIEKSVRIEANTIEYYPVLSAMENIYSLDTKRNIILAFVPDVGNEEQFYTSKKLGFVYHDELFDLGVNRFVFDRIELNESPIITY